MNPLAFIKEVLTYNWFSHDNGVDGGIIPVTFNPGSEDCKLIVVTGYNASGKSFFRRCVGALCSKLQWEHIALSMEKRTGADFSDSCVRALMFGSEANKATGGISGHVITMGIKTASSRSNPNVLFFDEPDLGLSDEYVLDAAFRIADFAKSTSNAKLIAIVTHRRILLETLQQEVPGLHHLHCGAEKHTLSSWLNRPLKRMDIESLQEVQHQLFRKISQRMDENKNSKKK